MTSLTRWNLERGKNMRIEEEAKAEKERKDCSRIPAASFRSISTFATGQGQLYKEVFSPGRKA